MKGTVDICSTYNCHKGSMTMHPSGLCDACYQEIKQAARDGTEYIP
jgi:hypothetical protein